MESKRLIFTPHYRNKAHAFWRPCGLSVRIPVKTPSWHPHSRLMRLWNTQWVLSNSGHLLELRSTMTCGHIGTPLLHLSKHSHRATTTEPRQIMDVHFHLSPNALGTPTVLQPLEFTWPVKTTQKVSEFVCKGTLVLCINIAWMEKCVPGTENA